MVDRSTLLVPYMFNIPDIDWSAFRTPELLRQPKSS